MNELINRSVYDHAQSLRNKEYSAVELTQAYIDAIAQREAEIHAYISTDAENALKQAVEADKRIGAGEGTALTGIPAGIKDNMCTKEIGRASCRERMVRLV